MGLRLEICDCLLHGRFIDASGRGMEVGSREAAKFTLLLEERSGALEPGDRRRIEAAIAASMMAAKDDWIEADLRRSIHLWNLAAAATNDRAAFSKTDFHAFQATILK